MKSKKLLFLIFLLFIFVACHKEEKKEFILSGTSNIIEIANNGDKTAVFRVIIDNNDFSSEQKIMSFIKSMDEEYPEEPLEMKAFRFVRDYTWHDELVTRYNWVYSPYILVNSFGGGLCGLRSAVLTNILLKFGFEARSWSLEGHVVTEVHTGGRWKLLDVDNGVYYYTRENKIASYADLCSDESLITNPDITVVAKSDYNYMHVYSGKMAAIYLSTYDNTEFNVNYKISLENEELYFELPAGASITFPINKKHARNSYAFAELNIPSYFKGKINMPLVIAGMKGAGTVRYMNKNYQIDEFNTMDVVNKNTDVSFELDIIENSIGMKVYYYINPLLYITGAKSKIALLGENLVNLKVKYTDRTDLQLTLPYQNNYLYCKLKSLLPNYIIDSDSTEIKLDIEFLSEYFDRIIEVLSEDEELSLHYNLQGFRVELDSVTEVFRKDSLTDYSKYFTKENTIVSIAKLLNNHKIKSCLF